MTVDSGRTRWQRPGTCVCWEGGGCLVSLVGGRGVWVREGGEGVREGEEGVWEGGEGVWEEEEACVCGLWMVSVVGACVLYLPCLK